MCTSFQLQAADGSMLFARTMDWHQFNPQPYVLPRHFRWQTVYNQRTIENPYAILGVGRPNTMAHADMSDGINEHGLAAQKLTFSNRSEYHRQADPTKIQLAPWEFAMYILGHFQSVADVVDHLADIQLMTDEFSLSKYGRNDLHYAISDATGAMVNLDPIDGKIVPFENPIKVVTNAPTFAKEIERLNEFLTFTDTPSNVNRISTGNFNGKKRMPGTFSPADRFVRATLLKEYAVLPANGQENVIEAWHILNNVTVPKSESRSDTYTIYRSAVDLTSRRLYVQKYNDFGISSYRFPDNI